jgi:hypothetical protein
VQWLPVAGNSPSMSLTVRGLLANGQLHDCLPTILGGRRAIRKLRSGVDWYREMRLCLPIQLHLMSYRQKMGWRRLLAASLLS